MVLNTLQLKTSLLVTVLILVFFCLIPPTNHGKEQKMIILPKPDYHGETSVESALKARSSIRNYTTDSLTLEQVSQLLWAAQGLIGKSYQRTAPSAGALYPVEVYIVAGNTQGLEPGVYHYHPKEHGLSLILEGDLRSELATAALGQNAITDGAMSIVVAGVYERTASKYGSRSRRYVHLEAGHISQNIYLQATALKLGTVAIGAFHDDRVKRVLDMEDKETPLYIMPIGRRQ